MPRLVLPLVVAPVCVLAAWLAACGGSSHGASSTTTDASTDAPPAAEAGVPESGYVPLPPSDDCRYVDDGTTCPDTYFLVSSQLYACGHLTTVDANDAGTDRPYPPPLPGTYDCRNVAAPVTDAGLTQQVGALWCCIGNPSVCARAAALDPMCAGGTYALSCPATSPVFPAGTADGGSCSLLLGDTADDAGESDGASPDAGLTLTPPRTASEAVWCCRP